VLVFTGVYPKPMLERIEPAVVALIEHVETKAGIETAELDVVELDEHPDEAAETEEPQP
jgi:NADH-quinone oxidoreductase subunit M